MSLKNSTIIVAALAALTVSACSPAGNNTKQDQPWDSLGKAVRDLHSPADNIDEGQAGEYQSGYTDRNGKLVIPPKFDYAAEFVEGMGVVQIGGKYGYINKQARLAIKPQFDNAFDFSDGLGVVQKDDKLGYVDKTGVIVIPVQYSDAHDFSEGLAAVEKDGDCFYIDKKGKKIFTLPKGAHASDVGMFSDGLAVYQEGGKCGFIDRTGKIVIKPQFDVVGDFHDGIAPIGFAKPTASRSEKD